MKFINTNEDEYRAVKGKIAADVFFMGDGTAEVKLLDEAVEAVKSEKAKYKKIDSFAAAVSKALKKRDIHKAYITADRNSVVDKALDAGKKAAYDYSEYMYKLEASPEKTPEETTDSCIILDTKNAEDTDFEQKNAIVVRSREAGVFSAKIMPYMDGMYVYEVEVNEKLRHQGHGTRHMEALMAAFSDAPIYLQVSSKNKPAIGLYQKLGFKVATGINYYTI